MRAGGEGAMENWTPVLGPLSKHAPDLTVLSGGPFLAHSSLVITHPGPGSFQMGQTGIDFSQGCWGCQGLKIRHGPFCGPSGEMAHTGCQGGGLAGRRGIGGEGWVPGEV